MKGGKFLPGIYLKARFEILFSVTRVLKGLFLPACLSRVVS